MHETEKLFKYIIYTKCKRSIDIIGTSSMFDHDGGLLTIYNNNNLVGRFILDNLEGYEIRELEK